MSSDRSGCTESYGSASNTDDRRPDSAATSRPDSSVVSYTGPMSGCSTVLKTDETGTGSARSVSDATAERSDVSRQFEEMAQEREKRRRADEAISRQTKIATYGITRSEIDRRFSNIFDTLTSVAGGDSNWAQEVKDTYSKYRSEFSTAERDDVDNKLRPGNQDEAANEMALKLYTIDLKMMETHSDTRTARIKSAVFNALEQPANAYRGSRYPAYMDSWLRVYDVRDVARCVQTQTKTLNTLQELDIRLKSVLAERTARLTAETSRASNSAMYQSSTPGTNSRPESTGFRSAAPSRLDSSLPSNPSFAPTDGSSTFKLASQSSRPNTSLPPKSSLAPTDDLPESKPPSKDRAPSRSTQSTAFTVGTSLCATAVVAGGAYLAYNKWWKD